nr:immunoglobulin heavy chain junction region [Macaca mulatta]
CAKKEDDFDSW